MKNTDKKNLTSTKASIQSRQKRKQIDKANNRTLLPRIQAWLNNPPGPALNKKNNKNTRTG